MPILKIPSELQLNNLPQIGQYKLSEGLAGNLDTIKMMKQVARHYSGHPVIRRLSLNVLDEYGIESQNHLSEALAIGDFVKNHITYRQDPNNIEYLQDPLTMIENITRGVATGDCDDMALLIATMLLSVGLQPYFRAVRYNSFNGNYNHIYIVAHENDWNSPSTRVVLDAILKRDLIGTEVPHKSGKDYII